MKQKKVTTKNETKALNKALVTCRCKEKVIKYWVAITPEGKEIEIRGIAKKNLKNGMELTGEIIEDEVQDKYTDGSYARSFTIEEWLQVSNGG